jgi:capsular exopolysaccharide synthesis family protein
MLKLPILSEGQNGDDHPAVEAYRALRTRLLRFQAVRNIQSIAVTSGVAGEGKTLTTLNLALCYAQLFNARVLMLDGDLRTRGLTSLAATASPSGLAEVLEGTLSFESAVYSTNLPNLSMICAGNTSIAASELYAKPRWKEFMEWSSETFKLVLIDCPPILGLADFELIAGACDALLMVVRAHRTERGVLQDASRQIDKKKLLGIVLNAHALQQANYYGYYKKARPEVERKTR